MTDRTTAARRQPTRALRLRIGALAVALSALWVVALTAWTSIVEQGSWWVAAVVITTTVTVLTCILAAFRSARAAVVVLAPAAVGAVIGLSSAAGTGRIQRWSTEPGAVLRQVFDEILRGIAPIAPSGYLQDLILIAVSAWSLLAMLVLTSAGRATWAAQARPVRQAAPGRQSAVGMPQAVSAALVIALPMLAVPMVMSERLGAVSLLVAGVLLAVVMWLASPRVSIAGGVAAACAVALSAGTLAIVPAGMDRKWNDATQFAPVGEYVDDVTIELARSLSARSEAPMLRHTSSRVQPLYFRLATLSTFEGGSWLPDEALDPAARTVGEERLLASPRPGSLTPDLGGLEELTGGLRDERGRPELQTDAGSVKFSTDTGQLVAFEPASPEWATFAFDYDNDGREFVDVSIAGLRSSWLPLPTGTAVVSKDRGPLALDDWVWAAEANTARSAGQMTRAGDGFRAEVLPGGGAPPRAALRWIPKQLLAVYPNASAAPAELRPYLELPGELPRSLRDLRDSIAFAEIDRVSAASALEHFFRQSSRFTYDEEAPFLPGADPDDPYSVMDALLTTRAGFCVHFATTFAVAARSMGVPTRVAVGYASRSQAERPVTIKAKDLHAWPEVFIDRVGWVPYEPTPGGAGVRAEATSPEAADVDTEPVEGEQAEADTPELQGEVRELTPEELERSGNTERETEAGSGSGGVRWLPPAMLAFATVLLLGMLPAGVRLFRRVRRIRMIRKGAGPGMAAWAEFTDTLLDFGQLPGSGAAGPAQWPTARTPDAMIAALRERDVLSSARSVSGAAVLAAAVNEERYAPAAEAARSTDTAQETSRSHLLVALEDATAALRTAAARSERSRARWLPRSVFARTSSR